MTIPNNRRPREAGATDLARASIDAAEAKQLIPTVGGPSDDDFLDTDVPRERDYRAQQVPPPVERLPFKVTR